LLCDHNYVHLVDSCVCIINWEHLVDSSVSNSAFKRK
jgi:hypothetical protein